MNPEKKSRKSCRMRLSHHPDHQNLNVTVFPPFFRTDFQHFFTQKNTTTPRIRIFFLHFSLQNWITNGHTKKRPNYFCRIILSRDLDFAFFRKMTIFVHFLEGFSDTDICTKNNYAAHSHTFYSIFPTK